MRHNILVLPILLALGGCASEAGPTAFVSVASTETPETTPVGAADASTMIVQLPPPGGVVRSVREKSYPNGLNQQAVLDGSVPGLGENQLDVSVQTAPGNGSSATLNISPPSEDGIRREIIARYPKLQMRIVTQPRRNSLGVFGLAIARGGNGARCIFAWQWVDDVRGQQSDSGVSLFGVKFGGGETPGALPAAIRIHMCRKDASVDDLAATVEGMSLAAPQVIARALEPGRAMAATTPVRGGNRASVASNAPAGSLEAALGPSRPVSVAAAEPRRKARTYVARRRARPAPEGVTQAAPAPQQPPQYAGGPRYLAPVAGAPAAPMVYANPAPMASAAPQLDPSLPAAAYRGPSARNN